MNNKTTTIFVSIIFILVLMISLVDAYETRILFYYGNGGTGGYGGTAYHDLRDFYRLKCYPCDSTDVLPTDFSPYFVVFLLSPGYWDDGGTYFFDTDQVIDLENFLRDRGRIVIISEHSALFGYYTINDLLSRLGGGINIRLNYDFLKTFYTTDITPDQITDGVSEILFDGIGVCSLEYWGTAKSLVRLTVDETIIAVDTLPASPPFSRPSHDVVVIGDHDIFDEFAPYDNSIFMYNLVNFIPPLCEPPVADAGDDKILECTSSSGTEVTLDGSASSDPDSTPGTHHAITSFDWYADYGLPTQVYMGFGEIKNVILSIGTHNITLVVTDTISFQDNDSISVTIQDTTLPEIFCPDDITHEGEGPGGAYITLAATATDICDDAPEITNSYNSHGADASDTYPIGITTVVFTAIDDSGNESSCSVRVG